MKKDKLFYVEYAMRFRQLVKDECDCKKIFNTNSVGMHGVCKNYRYFVRPAVVGVEGDKLKLKRTMVFFKGEYKNEGYDRFKTFFEAIEKVEKRKLVLNSKT